MSIVLVYIVYYFTSTNLYENSTGLEYSAMLCAKLVYIIIHSRMP